MSDFGENLKWFLSDVENADKDQIEHCLFDMYGETIHGFDTSCEVDLRELCGAALKRIELLEKKVEEITERHTRPTLDIEGGEV
tara:strand:+ start:2997 stop:3248 length:252 start_codon:yes stop_codon:yes gene_type:complete